MHKEFLFIHSFLTASYSFALWFPFGWTLSFSSFHLFLCLHWGPVCLFGSPKQDGRSSLSRKASRWRNRKPRPYQENAKLCPRPKSNHTMISFNFPIWNNLKSSHTNDPTFQFNFFKKITTAIYIYEIQFSPNTTHVEIDGSSVLRNVSFETFCSLPLE